MIVVYLDELTSEQHVIDMLPELENEVIEAICTARNKPRMITATQMQVKQVIKKCAVNRWQKAKKKLNVMFKALEAEAMTVEQNLWQL